MHSYYEPGMLRFWWNVGDEHAALEVSWSSRFKLGVEYGAFCSSDAKPHLNISLMYVSIFVSMPRTRRRPNAQNGWGYGFTVSQEFGLIVLTGDDTGRPGEGWRSWDWPWRKRVTVLDHKGPTRTYPYRYELLSGEVQERTATVYVREVESHWLFRGNPLGRRYGRCMDFEFDDEVGEQTGSWKGGVIASSEPMRPGEDVVATLRRMERERRF